MPQSCVIQVGGNLLTLGKSRTLKFQYDHQKTLLIGKLFFYMKKAVRKYFTVAREETLSLVNTLTNCCEYGWNIWRKRVHVRLISCNDIAVEDAFCWTVGYCLRGRRYEGDIG